MKEGKFAILVVDDIPDNLVLASALLKNQYRVKAATSGEKALAIARTDPPDLILLDVMMPEMDGYETCAWLKADAQLKQIPVIFLTAKGEVEDEEKGFALGAVDYIVKPLTPSLLLARVKTQLTLKNIQDDLKNRNTYLETEIAKRLEEVTLLQEVAHHSHGVLGGNTGLGNLCPCPANRSLRQRSGDAFAPTICVRRQIVVGEHLSDVQIRASS